MSYWQQGVDDARAGAPRTWPASGGAFVRANRGYAHGYEWGRLHPAASRDPALQQALDAFTLARAQGDPQRALQARADLLWLLGVAEDDGRFDRLKERAQRRRADCKARGDLLGQRVADQVLQMIRNEKAPREPKREALQNT